MKNKNFSEILKRFITATLVSFAVYLLTATILFAVFESVGEYALFAVSVVYSAVFSYFYIYYLYIRDVSGIDVVFSEYKDKSFSIIKDLPVMLKREYKVILAIWVVNILSWLLIRVEQLLLGKRFVSNLFIFFAPIQFVGEALPSWGWNILGYVIGALMTSVIYMIMITFFRKHWSK